MNKAYGSWVMAVACVCSLAACKKSSSTNNSGTGGTGATAGTSAAGTTATAGTMAAAGAGGGMKKAVAMITPFMGTGTTAMAQGTATFVQSGTDVTVTVALTGCVDGKMYPVHIHEGTSCATEMAQGAHWGPTRGEGIPKVMCMGTSGMATLTRMPTDPTLAWTVGGDTTTNVVGHAFVVHDPDVAMTPPRIGCGVITMQ